MMERLSWFPLCATSLDLLRTVSVSPPLAPAGQKRSEDWVVEVFTLE
jgi:hypothetical protein